MATQIDYVLRAGIWQPLGPGSSIPGDGDGDPTPPPPPPGGTGMLVGGSINQGISNDYDPATLAGAGPWTIARRYNSGNIGATWQTDPSGCNVDVGKRASAWSAKPNLTSMTNGSLDTAVKNFVTSIPDSHVAFLTIWHEPDVKKRQGSLDPALFRPGFQRFCELVKSVGKPNVYTYLCLSNFAANGATDGLPPEYWVGPDGASRIIDVVTWDIYLTKDIATTATHEQLNPYNFTKSHGAAYGITEIGIHEGVTDFTLAAGWMHTQADYAATQPAGGHSSAAFLCWFDSNNATAIPVPSAAPAMMTASASISASYQTPYLTFRL